MRIFVVNPNSTASMTEKAAAAARAVASAGTVIEATQPDDAPASIEGAVDGALAVPPMLRVIARAEREAGPKAPIAAFVIACFDDTGLDAARSVASAPVIGIGEAAFHVASLVAPKFSVVTTLGRSVPVIEDNLIRYGLAARCARVRAAEVPVLALEEPGSSARERIAQEIDAALREDHAEAIVLGCAGMADLANDYAKRFGIPVIDGVAAAVKLAEAVGAMGLRTPKLGAYAPPLPKRGGFSS